MLFETQSLSRNQRILTASLQTQKHSFTLSTVKENQRCHQEIIFQGFYLILAKIRALPASQQEPLPHLKISEL